MDAIPIRTSFLAGAVIFSVLVPASSARSDVEQAGASLTAGGLSLCGEEPAVLGDGRFVLSGTTAPFALRAGLWVGARVDRGAGEEPGVSGTLYADDFVPVGDAPAPRAHGAVRARYTDIGAGPPEHAPLGLEVVQISSAAERAGSVEAIRVSYRIRNVSGRLRPGGWTLREAYLGILADPDMGTADAAGQRHLDDRVALLPDRFRGDLAYAYDEPGTEGDDTTVQFGVVFPGRATHRFAVQSGGDFPTDAERYAWMRGASDTEPTIDPNTVRANDYRFLVAVGPIGELRPGASVRLTALLLCGDLAPAPATGRGPELEVAAPDAAARPIVAPNPVRLAGGTATFTGLPEGEMVRIYSVEGRLVERLRAVGSGASWNLRGADGAPVAAGVYYYRIGEGPARIGRIVVLR